MTILQYMQPECSARIPLPPAKSNSIHAIPSSLAPYPVSSADPWSPGSTGFMRNMLFQADTGSALVPAVNQITASKFLATALVSCFTPFRTKSDLAAPGVGCEGCNLSEEISGTADMSKQRTKEMHTHMSVDPRVKAKRLELSNRRLVLGLLGTFGLVSLAGWARSEHTASSVAVRKSDVHASAGAGELMVIEGSDGSVRRWFCELCSALCEFRALECLVIEQTTEGPGVHRG
ncbi:hypothetical protein B0H17DRAFT_1135941 [Mycena rosella]|uniref:Uncharacterized protein n=1 Tax=Mycena rosella TaxID=1033263 RepID=A0AAD7GEZ7_MYCRO|nr:hypothetical protein B0H17DRAFT_1135941 [Mycena rosella]